MSDICTNTCKCINCKVTVNNRCFTFAEQGSAGINIIKNFELLGIEVNYCDDNLINLYPDESNRIKIPSNEKTINIRSDIKHLSIYGDLEILNVYGQVENIRAEACGKLKQINLYGKVDYLDTEHCNEFMQINIYNPIKVLHILSDCLSEYGNKNSPVIDLFKLITFHESVSIHEYPQIHECPRIYKLALTGVNFIPDNLSIEEYDCLSKKISDLFQGIKKFEFGYIRNTIRLPFLAHAEKVTLNSMHDLEDVSDLSSVKKIILTRSKYVKDIQYLANAEWVHLEQMDNITDVSSLKNVDLLVLYGMKQITDVSMMKNKKLYLTDLPNITSKTLNMSDTEYLSIRHTHFDNIKTHNVKNINIDDVDINYASFNKSNRITIERCRKLINIEAYDINYIYMLCCNNFKFMKGKSIDTFKSNACPDITDLAPFKCVTNLELNGVKHPHGLHLNKWTDLFRGGA